MSDQGTIPVTTRVLSAVLSPWFAFSLVLAVICFFYFSYWKPRLHHAYPCWPKTPQIYFTLPFRRRKAFLQNPSLELGKARREMRETNVFWTDIVPDYKTVTLINNDQLVCQFLSTEHKEELSWDAATRYAWDHLFEKASPFGRSAPFHEACRYCLSSGFSRARTSLTSPVHRVTSQTIETHLAMFGDGNLYDVVDKIVAAALGSLFLGPQSARILPLYDDLFQRLCGDQVDKKQETQLAQALRSELNSVVQARVADSEQYANDDYLGFILSDQTFSAAPVPASSTAPTSTLQDSASGVTQSQDSSSDATEASDLVAKSSAVKNLPDHFLSALLQTRMLVTTCVFWKLYSAATAGRQTRPDPLLLVRQATEETLLGSHSIPKDAFVAICPAGELRDWQEDRGLGSSRGFLSRQGSTTELADLPGAYSVATLSDLASQDGTGTLPHSNSISSFSPLLRNTRRPSQSSSFTPKGEADRATLLSRYRSRQGTWQRHYPQGHLISLMVGSLSNELSGRVLITGSGEAEAVYGNARSLFLPHPSVQVSVAKGAVSGLQAPVSFYRTPRQDSAIFMTAGSTATNTIAEDV